MQVDAVVFAAYGTARSGAAERSIAPVVRTVAEALPVVRCELAYTSVPVVRALSRRRVEAPLLEDVLDRLVHGGCGEGRGKSRGRIVVQPGYVASGWALYDLECRVRSVCGDRAVVGAPLVASDGDSAKLAGALSKAHPRRDGVAQAFVAHGEAWPKDAAHPVSLASFDALESLRHAFAALGRTDVIVTSMRDFRSAVDAAVCLDAHGVELVPLMLSAGNHAARQLFGADAESAASQFAAAGIAVEAFDEGIGACPDVQHLYASHALSLLG